MLQASLLTGNFSGLVTADKLDKLTKKCVIQERIDNLTKLHTGIYIYPRIRKM